MRVGRAVIDWYRSVLDRDDGAARAARARLRRCHSPVEALAVAETHDLNRRLKDMIGNAVPGVEQLALVAVAFACLKGVDGDPLAAQFGKKNSADGPRVLSELRFQSLIRIRSCRELMTPLRRSMAVLGRDASCNGWALAEDLYRWNDRVRNKWCFQYFGTGFAEKMQEETK